MKRNPFGAIENCNNLKKLYETYERWVNGGSCGMDLHSCFIRQAKHIINEKHYPGMVNELIGIGEKYPKIFMAFIGNTPASLEMLMPRICCLLDHLEKNFDEYEKQLGEYNFERLMTALVKKISKAEALKKALESKNKYYIRAVFVEKTFKHTGLIDIWREGNLIFKQELVAFIDKIYTAFFLVFMASQIDDDELWMLTPYLEKKFKFMGSDEIVEMIRESLFKKEVINAAFASTKLNIVSAVDLLLKRAKEPTGLYYDFFVRKLNCGRLRDQDIEKMIELKNIQIFKLIINHDKEYNYYLKPKFIIMMAKKQVEAWPLLIGGYEDYFVKKVKLAETAEEKLSLALATPIVPVLSAAWDIHLSTAQKAELYLQAKKNKKNKTMEKEFRQKLSEIFVNIRTLNEDDADKAIDLIEEKSDDHLWLYLALSCNRNLGYNSMAFIGHQAKNAVVWQNMFASRGIEEFQIIIEFCNLDDLLSMDIAHTGYPTFVIENINKMTDEISDLGVIFNKLLENSNEKVQKIGRNRFKTIIKDKPIDFCLKQIINYSHNNKDKASKDKFIAALISLGNSGNDWLKKLMRGICALNTDMDGNETAETLAKLLLWNFKEEMAHFGTELALKTKNSRYGVITERALNL
jgi:hypothetical protein